MTHACHPQRVDSHDVYHCICGLPLPAAEPGVLAYIESDQYATTTRAWQEAHLYDHSWTTIFQAAHERMARLA